MRYPLKNLIWTIIVVLYCILALLLSGCASDQPWVSVSTYSMDARYVRQCMGPNAPFRPTDRECRVMNEPISQPGSVERIERIGAPGNTWRERTDVLIWCRQNEDNTSPGCRGIPPIRRTLLSCGDRCE